MLRRMNGHSSSLLYTTPQPKSSGSTNLVITTGSMTMIRSPQTAGQHACHAPSVNQRQNNPTKKYAYIRARTQRTLRQMKNEWWANKAQELQQAADRRDMKAFYHSLKAVYGPRDSGSVLSMAPLSLLIGLASYLAGQTTSTMSSTSLHRSISLC